MTETSLDIGKVHFDHMMRGQVGEACGVDWDHFLSWEKEPVLAAVLSCGGLGTRARG